MATGLSPITQLQRINDENLSGGVMNLLLQAAPLVAQMASIVASNGTDHKFLEYGPNEANDTSGAGFRDVNDGRVLGHSLDNPRTIECKILDASTEVDAALADGYRFGPAAWLERENMRALRNAFARLERQIINGTAGSPLSDAAGFAGMGDVLNAVSNTMVDDAGGTTNLTSVYLIRSDDPLTSAAVVLGNDGNITVDPSVKQAKDGTTANSRFPVWYTPIYSWYAYQDAGLYGQARLANVDSQSATPVVTDDRLSDLIKKFPIDRQGTHFVMNRDARAQLQQSRTATNATGAPAPFPMEAFGVPIVTTDQVSNNETQVT